MRVRKITVTYPEQTFAPIQYHSFRAGGISMEIEVGDDEKASEAFKKALTGLSILVNEQFAVTLEDFLRRAGVARDAARGK